MLLELFARYVRVHVDSDDGFVIPLGGRRDEELVAVEDEGSIDPHSSVHRDKGCHPYTVFINNGEVSCPVGPTF